MRILIENGTYELQNLGDVSMLQLAVSRLRGLFPEAEIDVITQAPELLQKYCPGCVPVSPLGRELWFNAGIALGTFKRGLPKVVRNWAEQTEQWIKYSAPEFTVNWRRKRDTDGGRAAVIMRDFVNRVRESNLVVASGGGYLTDEFADWAPRRLSTIRLANAMGKPTALLGQGIGPIRLPAMRDALRSSLAGVKSVGLRETRRGPAILESAGVPPSVIHSTGDDAIELALRCTPPKLGGHIGLNFRCVDPRGSETNRTRVMELVKEFALSSNASIVPAPISYRPDDDDAVVARDFIKRTGAPTIAGLPDPQTPQEVIERVSTCRLVITGSYHAAVFALSQGIPSIALAEMEYYQDKFLGLFEQFGVLDHVILLNQPDWERSLQQAIQAAWEGAEHDRPRLLDAAAAQVQRGRCLYAQLQTIHSIAA
jgi:colanic acid/amylovoran biosynthesis protein